MHLRALLRSPERTTDEDYDSMKSILGTLALCMLFTISSIAFAADAADPVVGTWKLNTTKSSGSVPTPKSETRTYAAAPDGVALTWTRVAADGKESVVKTTFKYDGKDYPVTGSPDFDALSAKKIDANTIESKQSRKGKPIGTTTRTVSADGKTLTLVSKLTTANGTLADTNWVYDRQ
jgi:hypothetical protein